MVAITLEFFMPAQFITPIYIDDEKQQEFASTQSSEIAQLRQNAINGIIQKIIIGLDNAEN